MQSDIVDAPAKFKGTGSYILEDTNFPGFGKMQLHLASTLAQNISYKTHSVDSTW